MGICLTGSPPDVITLRLCLQAMQSSPLGRLVTKVGDEMVPGASASSLEPPQPIYPAGKIKASVGAPRAMAKAAIRNMALLEGRKRATVARKWCAA